MSAWLKVLLLKGHLASHQRVSFFGSPLKMRYSPENRIQVCRSGATTTSSAATHYLVASHDTHSFSGPKLRGIAFRLIGLLVGALKDDA